MLDVEAIDGLKEIMIKETYLSDFISFLERFALDVDAELRNLPC